MDESLAGTARLAGKVAVIAGIGGAIGTAVAGRFAREGAVVVGIDQAEVETGAALHQADLTDESQVREAFAHIADDFGRIDVLYNNAGPLHRGDSSIEVTDLETWDQVFRSVLTPTVLACKYAVPLIRANGPAGGSIINTGSFLAGMGAATAQMAFSAAKAAVVQLTRDLGTNLARANIRVNALALGPVETPEIREMFARLGDEGRSRRFTHIPNGRFATLEEIAGAAAFLASADAGYLTADELPVVGGIRNAYTIPD
ncbi:SDR family oxidoreductase [Streptomyces sp. NPDC020766]|uniref:SDR family oxidoreductase n=1 Tax=Streptomyces sp. NPDC020766 TaxID=3155011 RepID=UPI0033D06A20